MPVMLPSAEQLATWAAEELWDWRVRALFAVVCLVVMLVVLIIYLKWGRNRKDDTGRMRRYLGRMSTSLLVVTIAEASFFKEPVSTVLLLVTSLAIGVIALGVPGDSADDIEQSAETV